MAWQRSPYLLQTLLARGLVVGVSYGFGAWWGDEAGSQQPGGNLERSKERLLALVQFIGYSLVAPENSNLLNFQEESSIIPDVRAGVPYPSLTLHASSNLGTNATDLRIKLMYASAEQDSDCLPGSAHEARNVVPAAHGSATSLDGATPAEAARNFENRWANIRFPYSGTFEACYFSGAMWRHVPGQFAVRGADGNDRKAWCVASTQIECRLSITGAEIRATWTVAAVDYTSDCGRASISSMAFERNYSVATMDPGDSARAFHLLGTKRDNLKGTYKICYCPGYNEDGIGDECTSPGDFVQTAGFIYTTRVTSPQRIYPKIRFDLVVNCGSESVGGCPLSRHMRVRIVEPSKDNDRPILDDRAGCRSAPQTSRYFLPANCGAPMDCSLEPVALSKSMPRWEGMRISGMLENHAQVPFTLDVCFCIADCVRPESWFKADRIATRSVAVLPNPLVANRVVDLQLYGPDGGWTLAGDTHTREMKLLYDPEGTATAESCYLDPQDAQAVTGHVCYSTVDCQSPSSSTSDGHTWHDVRVRYAGMYALCYCDARCTERGFWTFLQWQLVAGPSSKHTWEFSRGINFDVTVSGLGLSRDTRLLAAGEDHVCGESSADAPADGIVIPEGPPTQKGDPSGFGLASLSYVFDGMLVVFFTLHGLSVEDYVSFSGVASDSCWHCEQLINGRPHKVIRVPTPRAIVIPVVYPEKAFPDFELSGATWLQSNQISFEHLLGNKPGMYRMCLGGGLPLSAVTDFVGIVGTLRIFEPPMFVAGVHLTSSQAQAVAPVVISFTTRKDPKYASGTATGETQFKVHFRDLSKLMPGFSFSTSSPVVSHTAAQQRLCGMIFRELWSSDSHGFPMPKGCFYQDTDTIKEYGLLFSARNGLRGGMHYQMVMDAVAAASLGGVTQRRDGIINLWSMDDVHSSPFGVIEYATAFIDRPVLPGAIGAEPQFHPVDGVNIVAQDGVETELSYEVPWQVLIGLRASAGAPIGSGSLLRIFLWPLTQWDIAASCVAQCRAQQQMVGGTLTPMRCESPVCAPEAVAPAVTGEYSLGRRNSLWLTFGEMDPVTDLVRHTVVLSQLRVPVGGFFSTALGAEVRSSVDGGRPSYMVSSGSLIWARPSATGSVVTHPEDGDDRPFRGDQGNTLYVRLVLGASIWSPTGGDANFEISLPQGYTCLHAQPADAELAMLRSLIPQGRGEVGVDPLDGYWLYSGQSCKYVLQRHGIVYAGSVIYVKLSVNNPVFALQRTDPRNTWTVQLTGKGAPFVSTSRLSKLGKVSPFVDVSHDLRRNTPVLGKMTGATLSPTLFGAGQVRNWLSVFFTTEQGSHSTMPQLELKLPPAFGFLPQCVVERLPSYHYSVMSSRRTGLTMPTHKLRVSVCQASRGTGSTFLNVATMTLSRFTKLKPANTYGFRIRVFNAKSYEKSQQDGFRLTTRSSEGDGVDATYHTIRYIASDGEGPGASFGVYRLPMRHGSFVVSIENMLPYTETGHPSRVVVFPLRVPFDARVVVDWRIIAPQGYEWEFHAEQFRHRVSDILGATADLPIARPPAPPALPPKNVLVFISNFLGAWDRTRVYGFIAYIRVPDATPRSTVNSFIVEFGYAAELENGRMAAASYEAPQVRALINAAVDYQMTNLAGQQNRVLLRLETITSLTAGGGLVIETPQGFVFESRCALLDNPTRQPPVIDLTSSAFILCASEVPYTTGRPLVTITVRNGEVRPAQYEFMIDTQNPRVVQDAAGMMWSISAYTNVGTTQTADITATLEGFPIEAPMRSGEIVDTVRYALTQRDDHPVQRSFVVLAFELREPPAEEFEEAVLMVKAPMGFEFSALCEVVIGRDVFGLGESYPQTYSLFEPGATVAGCEGSQNKAYIVVKRGLLNLRKYAFRLEVLNPSETPEYNRWTLSFAGESTTAFRGYRLWSFTGMHIAASHAARSTAVEETHNIVVIRFRPTNAVGSAGFLSITAPFGFRISTECLVTIRRLDPLNQPISTVPHTSCRGAPQPTNVAEVHITDQFTQIVAPEVHLMELEVINPLSIPSDPGVWRLHSYATKDSEYASLLDVGEAPGFTLTEVFHTLLVIYPQYIDPLEDLIQLTFQFVLPHNVELGDVVEINGPQGYDFSVASTIAQHEKEFRACRSYVRHAPEMLPDPLCLQSRIRFAFQSVGIPLEPRAQLTPLSEFGAQTVYPRRTLEGAENVFHGEHMRGALLMSSKTVPGEMVTPRLQGMSVVRLDTNLAVGSKSRLQLAFSPSQSSSALRIMTTGARGSKLDTESMFRFLEVVVAGSVETQPIFDLTVVERTNTTLAFQIALAEGFSYRLILKDVMNPVKPGRALWTITTYERPASSSSFSSSLLLPANRRDRSENIVGPPIFSRILLDQALTTLAQPFFDMDATELEVAFRVYPDGISAGQKLILYAPFGFAFVDRTFKPGDGFPLVSGSVYVRGARGGNVQDPWAGRAYVIETRSRILAQQLIRFFVRVDTPRTPDDIAVWETDHSSSWLLLAASDEDGQLPSASNDYLFPGFELKASFGTARVEAEPNGVTPSKTVSATVLFRPQAAMKTLRADGSVHVRITAPVGFDFDAGCLAVTPNVVFMSCTGNGRRAVLPVRDGALPSGQFEVVLRLTNAGFTPAVNVWLLESFVDVPEDEVELTEVEPRQQSIVEGYEIRELIQATIGANTQRGAVTTIFVWFLATNFIDVGGALELHAPQGYELRCTPQVIYITLPAGSCRLQKGTTSSGLDDLHHFLTLTLTLRSQLMYPNTAYEFGAAAVNPEVPADLNFWGLVLRNPYKEVVDATMTLDGFELTDYGMVVESLIALNTLPTVVNFVRLTLTFQKELEAGLVQHLTIFGPITTKVLCQHFSDLSGGGSSSAMLPLDLDYGTYGTHSCQFQNSMTLHMLATQPITARSYLLQIGVLNPAFRAVRDFWAVELLVRDDAGGLVPSGGQSGLAANKTPVFNNNGRGNSSGSKGGLHVVGADEWRIREPALRVQVMGFGVSGAYSGIPLSAVPLSYARRPGGLGTRALLLLSLLLVLLMTFLLL